MDRATPDVHPATNCVDPGTNGHINKTFLKMRGTRLFRSRNPSKFKYFYAPARPGTRPGQERDKLGPDPTDRASPLICSKL